MSARLNDGYDQPHLVSDLTLTFGADLGDLLPPWSAIPEMFKQDRGDARPWCALQSKWFFEGIEKSVVRPLPGIDPDVAWRHLTTVQRSFEPKHEHKSAAVAWLMSRWFEAVQS